MATKDNQGSQGSKSEQWNSAVAKATGAQAPGSNAPAIPTDGAFVKKVGADEIAAIMADSNLEFAPQIHSMEEGQMIEGVLEGNGPEAEFEHLDKHTGVVTTNTVQTWIIASYDGSKRLSILSSVQLDRKLPPFVGGAVKIVRGKDINIDGGRRVTDYLVAGPKLANNQRRTWAVPRKVLDASATERPALPAGAEQTNHANA